MRDMAIARRGNTAVLSAAAVAEARALPVVNGRRRGVTELAAKHGVDRHTISNAISGRTWGYT